MRQPVLAFLYNIRHQYPDPNNPQSQVETDFDDVETIEIIAKYLTQCGYEVVPIEANDEAYFRLHEERARIDLVFNYSMGMYGAARYAHLPAMLEMLRLPYTGSDPLTQALVMNKAKMQDVLAANGVPVLPSQVFTTADEPLHADLQFPLIVKPIAQGSSAGITAKSVVLSTKELEARVAQVLLTFREPAIVQPFLEGREFSVPMLGNPPRILPVIELDYSRLPEGLAHLDSLEVKWIFEEQAATHHLVCPALLTTDESEVIETTVRAAWDALRLRDWCRIDLRGSSDGKLYVLDVNSPPGVIPPEVSMTSYFPLSARAAGISYPDLLKLVIDTAWKRSTAPGSG